MGRRAVAAIVVCACVLGFGVSQGRAGVPEAETAAESEYLPMFDDPPLAEPGHETSLDPRCVTLWLTAMKRPEFDVRADAIAAVALAHRQGVPTLPVLAGTIPQLVAVTQSDAHPLVRLEAVRTLIELDQQDVAPQLLIAAQMPDASAEMVVAVDNAMVRWKIPAAREWWLSRLGTPERSLATTISAVQSLGAVRAAAASGRLRAIASDAASEDVLRIAAAKAIGEAAGAAALDAARELAARPSALDQLLAALTLRALRDPAAVDLAGTLASSSDPRTRATALGYLAAVSPEIVVERFAASASDQDEQVRLEAIRAFAAVATEPTVDVLAKALGDASLPVRRAAGAALVEMVRRDGRVGESARSAVLVGLTGKDWRALEQAAAAAGRARVSAATEPLLPLLSHERAEVRLAAATALRRLDVPETMPGMLDRLRVLSDQALKAAADMKAYESIGQESAQIIVALGRRRFAPAEDLLVKYIPKRSGFHPLARGAAVYAIGKINEGRARPDLTPALEARVADNSPVDPEAAEVRRFAAVGLARMGSRSSLSVLNEFLEAENSTVSVGGACRWAIMQLEKKDLPPLRPIVVRAGPFFLEPID